MTTAEIGGLTFHGARHPSGLHFRRLIDWDSLPDLKDRSEPRPLAHGDFTPDTPWRTSKVISLEGWYQGATRTDALLMRRRMTGALAADGLTITVTDELGPTSRAVSVRGAPLPEPVEARFEFAIDMLAVDPRRYGPATTVATGVPVGGGGLAFPFAFPAAFAPGGSDGRIRVENPGETDTYTVLEVTGGMSDGFSITEVGTGRELRVERFIPVDSTVTLNSRTGSVTIDGPANDISGYLIRSDWPTIPAGAQTTFQFLPLGTTTGTPTLTARTAPAYW